MRSSLRSNIITGGATAFAIAVAAPASALAAHMPVKAPPRSIDIWMKRNPDCDHTGIDPLADGRIAIAKDRRIDPDI
jgi:hypothetical protein